ncbi:tetratricopeptide repeat protein [Nocardia bovistercoris]|uniref:Tetratricopeptide repeat protein n=1 Tax=Nocardia bovistercoris TaxID=2785916 RepID=A0A931IGC1_9NOCA|nr:tetratricopeptide repeat protein [Nocardia bovistercoris]
MSGSTFNAVDVGGDLTAITAVVNPAVTPPPPPLIELIEVIGSDGGLPAVADLDCYQLGATPSEFGAPGRSGSDDPYVRRTHNDVDERLASALRRERLVLLVGQSKAGKTRSLFEAVRLELPDARILVPNPDSLPHLANCDEFVGSEEPIVIWLENLDRFLVRRRPLTLGLLNRLTARRARTVVAATMRSEARDRLSAGGEDLAYEIRSVLDRAVAIELAPTSDDSFEHAAAMIAYPMLSLGRHGLAEILAGAPEQLRRYDVARFGNPALHAVLQVAIDWARIGHPRPVPEDLLIELTMRTIEDQRPELDVTVEQVREAIGVARLPTRDAGSVAALVTHRLPDRSRAYRPFDYLVAADDGAVRHHSHRDIPPDFWDGATRDADSNTLLSVGITARSRENRDASEALVRRAAEMGAGDAMSLLGLFLHERGSEAEAGIWYRRAADAGDVDAMGWLGSALYRRGAEVEAEAWYRRAAEAGDIRAMALLGISLQEHGDDAEAETWLRRAAEGDHSSAMRLLGSLLRERGDDAEAEIWLRRAALAGSTRAMDLLGILSQERGEDAEAEAWYRRAVAAGSTRAMNLLGILSQERGEDAEAEAWYRRAAEAGDIRAMALLGILLQERGDEAGAEAFYRKGIGMGDTNAMALLGSFLHDRGDKEQAEIWYRRGVEAGDTDATRWLGMVLQNRGAVVEAESLYRRAAASGDTDAMALLGTLLRDRGDAPEADEWFRLAAGARPADFGATEEESDRGPAR